VNVWDELLIKLDADTRESVNTDHTRLRFAAHLAILMMLHNRLTRPDEYNRIVQRYINSIVQSNLHENSKHNMVPFYCALLLGDVS
jgi:hypothetical protein